MTAAHVVGSLSEAADSSARVLYVAGFGSASSADQDIGGVTVSHPSTHVSEVEIDAALIGVRDDVSCDNVVQRTPTSCIGRDVEETLDEDNPVLVHKRGFSTDETSGLLVPVTESLEVKGRLPDGNWVVRTYLRGFFVFGDRGPFAEPGDSGAIVVDDDDCVVGMIVALRAANMTQVTDKDPAFVVPIGDLLDSLGVDLVGPARQCTIV